MNLSATYQGYVAELMVINSIIQAGYPAFLAAPQLHYDLVADVGSSLIRVQVKSVNGVTKQNRPKIKSYSFTAMRKSKGGEPKVHYPSDAFEIFAFVALDIGQIAFIPKFEVSSRAVRFAADSDEFAHSKLKRLSNYPFEKALASVLRQKYIDARPKLQAAFTSTLATPGVSP